MHGLIRCHNHVLFAYECLCIAAVDAERRDFSNVIQMVTFPPSSTEELRNLNITVFDDLINEATEGYLLMLEVVEAMSDPQDIENLQFVNGGTSLIVILDNDGKLYMVLHDPIIYK